MCRVSTFVQNTSSNKTEEYNFLVDTLLLSAQGKTLDDDVAGLHSLLLQVNKSSFNLFNEILRQGTEENYDIRVMLVGRAAVGKTTLTRRLLRLPVKLKSYDSTNGVDVHIHSCDIHLDSGEWGKAVLLGNEIRLYFWGIG